MAVTASAILLLLGVMASSAAPQQPSIEQLQQIFQQVVQGQGTGAGQGGIQPATPGGQFGNPGFGQGGGFQNQQGVPGQTGNLNQGFGSAGFGQQGTQGFNQGSFPGGQFGGRPNRPGNQGRPVNQGFGGGFGNQGFGGIPGNQGFGNSGLGDAAGQSGCKFFCRNSVTRHNYSSCFSSLAVSPVVDSHLVEQARLGLKFQLPVEANHNFHLDHRVRVQEEVSSLREVYNQEPARNFPELGGLSSKDSLHFLDLLGKVTGPEGLEDPVSYLDQQASSLDQLDSSDQQANFQDRQDNFPDLQANFPDQQANSQDLPASFQDLPASFQDLPASFQDLPASFQDLLASFQDLPASFQDLPANNAASSAVTGSLISSNAVK